MINRVYLGVVFLICFFLPSCGFIFSEVAIVELLGNYSGKVTYTYKYSMNNLGLQDKIREAKGSIKIFEVEDGKIYIQTGDGNILITGITLATNGTTFSIPYQVVVQKDKSVREIEGFQVTTLDGRKYDGLYLSDSETLTFSYHTMVDFEYWGNKYEVLVICEYYYSKN